MMRYSRTWPVFLVALPIVAVAAAPRGDEEERDEIELDEAEVFIEWNSTDGDFGIQFFWDGEPWSKMRIEDSDGDPVLRLRISDDLKDQGLTEGFFESAEPSADELSMRQFFDRFPEGEYEFEGHTLEGDELEGETEFTHDLPAPPAGLWPDGETIDPALPLVASFDAVTTTFDGRSLEPELYEVIIETEDELLRVMTMTVPGDVEFPSVTVPPEFLLPGAEYKLEVIVQEESGNRTISETEFLTQG